MIVGIAVLGRRVPFTLRVCVSYTKSEYNSALPTQAIEHVGGWGRRGIILALLLLSTVCTKQDVLGPNPLLGCTTKVMSTLQLALSERARMRHQHCSKSSR